CFLPLTEHIPVLYHLRRPTEIRRYHALLFNTSVADGFTLARTRHVHLFDAHPFEDRMAGVDTRIHRHHGDPRASGAIVGNVVQLSNVLDRGYRVRVRAHRFWFEVGFDGHVGFEREHAVVVGDGRFVFGVALDVGRPGFPEIVGLDHVTLDLREKRRRFVGEDDAFFHDRSIWASRRP